MAWREMAIEKTEAGGVINGRGGWRGGESGM
jgi:hypothetical protein